MASPVHDCRPCQGQDAPCRLEPASPLRVSLSTLLPHVACKVRSGKHRFRHHCRLELRPLDRVKPLRMRVRPLPDRPLIAIEEQPAA